MSLTLEPCIYWTLARQLPAGPEGLNQDWLSPAERERLGKLKFAARRNDWLAGRWAAKNLLRSADASIADVPLDSIEVRNDPQGAPYLTVGGEPWPGLISISHRAGRVACALAVGEFLGLGVDLERIEPRDQALVDDFFTEQEAEAVSICGDACREMWIPLIWSAKESILKALGEGLRMDARQVEMFPTLSSSPSHAPEWQTWWGCCSRLAGGAAEVLWQQVDDVVLTLAVLTRENQEKPRIVQVHLPDQAANIS